MSLEISKNTIEVGDLVIVGFYVETPDGFCTDKWKNLKGIVTRIENDSRKSKDYPTFYIKTSSGDEFYYFGDVVRIIKKNKDHRLKVVNAIIKEIASTGRRFFFNEKTLEIASLFIRGNKIFYKCEWVHNNIEEICLSVPSYRNPVGFYHGGTLQSLLGDFKHYILTGDPKNGLNGYGGLYCPHWGYSIEEMKSIRKLAFNLGYLFISP